MNKIMCHVNYSHLTLNKGERKPEFSEKSYLTFSKQNLVILICAPAEARTEVRALICKSQRSCPYGHGDPLAVFSPLPRYYSFSVYGAPVAQMV